MKKVITIILSVILFSSACSENAPLTNPDTITIATFNIQWLGDGFDDIKPRSSKDYDNIADIIRDLKADIIAVEEVENSAALKIILNRIDGYDFFISNKGSKQNVGIIYRKDISVESLGDYMPLEVSSGETRPGFIVKAQKGNFDFILMAVHFKSTSSYDSTAELKEKSRELRSLQAETAAHWVDSIISVGNEKNIIIAGDFNDYPTRQTDPTLTPLTDDSNLSFLTSGFKSCLNPFMNLIDHIVVSKSVKVRYIENSAWIHDFHSSLPEAEAAQISDHCPVLVRFDCTKINK